MAVSHTDSSRRIYSGEGSARCFSVVVPGDCVGSFGRRGVWIDLLDNHIILIIGTHVLGCPLKT